MNIAQVRAKYPQYQDLSDKQLADALHAKFYSDIPIQDYYGRIGLTSPKERTVGEAAKDIAASVVSGAGNLVQLPGQLYGLATGNFADTGALGLGKDIAKFGEEMKSAGLKAREAERAEKIKTAEQKGQWEAFKAAFGETVKDPGLLTSFLAEQAPQLLVPFGAAKVAQIGTASKAAAAAQGLTGTAAKEAVEAVTKESARRGTAAAVGAGAVQQGADVGSQAYEDIYKELKSKGASDADAAQGAINLARAAGASGALISLLAQRLPGAKTLEETFAGVRGPGGRLVGAARGALGEGASEIVEETGGKFGANLAMREVKPEQSLLEGLGATAGMAAVGGVGLGGAAGLAQRPSPKIEIINGKKFIDGKPVEEEPTPEAPVAPEAPVKPMVDRVMEMAAQRNGYGLLEQQKQRLLTEPKTDDVKEELKFIQEIQDRMNIETVQRATPSGKSPFIVTPKTLTELGISPTAPIIKRLDGKFFDDPVVVEQLEKFAANKNVNPEVQQNVLSLVEKLRQPPEPPVEPAPVSEAPTVETAPPVAPAPVEPVAEAAAVEPNVDSELVTPTVETPAPPVEAAAPVVEAAAAEEPVVETPAVETPVVEAPVEPVAEAPVAPPQELKSLGKAEEPAVEPNKTADKFLYSVEPTVKSDRLPSLKRGVDNVIKIYEKGWLSTDEFAIRINTLANQIETAKLAKEQAGRQRGADFLRQRLLEAKRRGELSEEAVDFAEWFILQNPKLVDELGISIRTPKEDGVGGMYSAYNRVMYLMKNSGTETTVVHEILHHLERMMPKEVQSAIRKTWIKSLIEAQKNAKTEVDKKFFKKLTDFHFEGGRRSVLEEALFDIKEGNVSKELYQYTSPSEFWAENASEIMKGRFDVKGSVLARLKQWLSELKEKARSLFGLENKAAIIRALDSLSKGDGQFVSKNLLDDSKETRQVVKQVRKPEGREDRATANFLRWFGDSKVVDENGEPLVVYHATDDDIVVFDAERLGSTTDANTGGDQTAIQVSKLGFWTHERALTDEMGKVAAMPLFVSIENPAVVNLRQLWSDINDASINGAENPSASVRDMYEADGYDGFVVYDEEFGGQSFVAFRPEQIKSAIGNNGDYSLTNPDIRKSLGKATDPGQQALETIRNMGMDVPKPDETKLQKAQATWEKAKENPKLTAQSAARAVRNFLDKVETWSFSSDAKLNNDFRRAIIKDIKENEGVIGQLLEMSQSQAVHADALASQFMIEGGLKYNEDLKKWESFDAKANFPALSNKLDEIGKKYNLSKEQIERVAHAYLVAKRLPGLIERNSKLDEEIKAEEASAKPDKKKIQDLKDKKVFVTEKQLEQVEPGLSLANTIPELDQVVDMWNEIRKNTIDVMVNSGLWSPEYAQAMWDNMDYVPYYREDQIENEAGPQEFIKGLQVKSKEFQLKGSDEAVHDVFDNMIRWTQYAINRSVRAHKALQMVDNAQTIPVGDRKMAEKVTEEKRGMNIVRVFRDGKQELYDMADPLYVQAFSGIQNVAIPTINFMARVSNVLRNSVVLYPLFSVAQVPQDSFAAMFTSGLKTQHALKIPYLAVKEFVKTLAKTSQTHETLKKLGATGVRDFSATVIRDDAEIYAGLKPPRGGWGKTKEVLSHISMAADNAVRQAVYEASIQQGVNRAEAIEKAFEVINFRRKGTSAMLNILGQTVPFFYAYLSAQRVAYKVLTGVGISPTDRTEAMKTLAMTSAAVATLSMLYAMANGDDEDYMETPANIRDRTITIPGSGGVRIPLRPDFFLFPKIVAEHTYLMLAEKGYQDAAKFKTSMKDALISAIASPTPFPTAIKPAIEVAINYDFFQGKPLIGNFEKQKDLERQFRDSTSEFSKLLGSTGMVSPIAADHLIRGMFGSFGGLFLYGTNQFLHSDPDVPRPELSAGEMLTALPGTSGLLKRPQESALKNDFYTLRDEVEKAVNTFNDIKTRSPQGMEDFLDNEKMMARYMLGKPVDQINRELSKIRRQMTIITNMPESMMSASEKADFIRELREYEREYLKSVDVKALREMAKI